MDKPDHIILVGGSAGAFETLGTLLPAIPGNGSIPVVVVTHIHPSESGELARHFNRRTDARVKEAEDKEPIQKGTIYLAPANYHLLVEPEFCFSLSMDKKVNFARPSIDVLFESAAFACRDRVTGILLTGANKDGARGISTIKDYGGLTIAQDPSTARFPLMPQAAVNTGKVDHVLTPEAIADVLAGRKKHE